MDLPMRGRSGSGSRPRSRSQSRSRSQKRSHSQTRSRSHSKGKKTDRGNSPPPSNSRFNSPNRWGSAEDNNKARKPDGLSRDDLIGNVKWLQGRMKEEMSKKFKDDQFEMLLEALHASLESWIREFDATDAKGLGSWKGVGAAVRIGHINGYIWRFEAVIRNANERTEPKRPVLSDAEIKRKKELPYEVPLVGTETSQEFLVRCLGYIERMRELGIVAKVEKRNKEKRDQRAEEIRKFRETRTFEEVKAAEERGELDLY